MNQRQTAPGNEAGMSADHGDVEAIGASGCPFCCPPLAQAWVSCLHSMQHVTGHYFMLPVHICLAPLLVMPAYHSAMNAMPCRSNHCRPRAPDRPHSTPFAGCTP